MQLDVIGVGPLEQKVPDLSMRSNTSTRINLLPPVEYGQPFFDLVRGYHLVMIPSVSDEQPRIVYDAFSQAIPVVGADTDGIRDCVDDGHTGWLFSAGNASALSLIVAKIARQMQLLPAYGIACLRQARNMTHRSMHEQRCGVLCDAWIGCPKRKHGA